MAVMWWAHAYSAAALPVPVLVVVGVVEVEGVVVVGVDLAGVPVRPPRSDPTVLPTVFVTPDRSWALDPPMLTSTQATATRRCIFQG